MRRILGLLLPTVLLVFGPATPAANAAGFGEFDYTAYDTDEGHAHSRWLTARWGNADFQFFGDYIWVQDNAKDGYVVGVQWKIGTRHGICVNNHGADIWNQSCNKDFPENRTLSMRLGRCDPRVYNCKDSTGWRNWTAWMSVRNT